MISVSLYDGSFAHAYSSSNGDLNILSKYVHFDRHNIHDIAFFTDGYVTCDSIDNPDHKRKIAWQLEPRSILPDLYSFDIDWSRFDYVLSSDRQFIKDVQTKFPNVISLWYPVGGTWIEESDRKIYNKTKNLSIIASEKRYARGHQMRHDIIDKFRSQFDTIAGRGYNTIDYKLEALSDYRFSVIIENDRIDDYFTEKLIDCLLTGTIPIYFGTNNIGNYFDTNGMLLIDNAESFENIIPYLTEEYYDSKWEYIVENFNRAQKYVNAEDWIYETYKDVLFV